MVTQKQYEFVKEHFEAENQREDLLTRKAQIFLSINSFVITAMLFKVKDLVSVVKDIKCDLILVPLILSFIFILISCIFIFETLKIRSYELPTNEDTLIDEFDNNISNDDFIDNRTADYLVATRRNKSVNDLKADRLKYSLLFIILGYVTSFTFITFLVI